MGRALQLIGFLALLAPAVAAPAEPVETQAAGAPAIDAGAFRIASEVLYTPAGTPVTVFHYFAVSADCGPKPVSITITTPPAHGRLALSNGSEAPVWAGRPLWADDDPRARCLDRLVATHDGAYAPDPGFSGHDQLAVTFTEGGSSFTDAIEVNVVTLSPPRPDAGARPRRAAHRPAAAKAGTSPR